ncbi:MAG: NAD(P)-dependent oxidoreductase [Spirochaetaceae bacterium]|nr:MAG: NAD(P)-dependent oxidoreductase [Spirochaetaceae bacterium]
MKPTVLLTGSSGRIGKRVLNKLFTRGYRVRALIHKNKPQGLAAGDVEFVQGDILDRNQMITAAKGIEVICHLAATFDMFPPVVFEKDNSSLFDNILRGTFNLLEAARSLSSLKLFVFASTDAVYATGPIRYDSPITEETEIQPMPGRFYALAKAVGESLCRNYGKTYAVPWTVIRINWALEDSELLRIFRYEFWEGDLNAEDRGRLEPKLGGGKGLLCPLFADGSPAIDQIADPDDTAEGFALAIDHFDKGKNNVFNIAAPGPFCYRDFIDRVAAKLGMPYESAVVKGYEPYSISNEKARKLLGYEPKHTMELMIEKALKGIDSR